MSSYLGGREGKVKLRYFERLDAVLRDQGYRLFLLNTHPTSIKTDCDAAILPFFIVYGHRLCLEPFISLDSLPSAVLEAASIGSEKLQRRLAGDVVRVLLYRAYLRSLVRKMRPALCVFWHRFNPWHQSMPDFCEQLGVPFLFTEYGLLTGTISFDEGGQMAESWIARRNEEFLALPVGEAELERATAVLERLRAHRSERKRLDLIEGPEAQAAAAPSPLDRVLDRLKKSGRPIIFYAGQNDYGSGMVPRTLPNAELHSPFFESTVDALRDLCTYAEERDAYVVFKPHPLVQMDLSDLDLPHPDRVDFVPGADIFECMAAAEVVVTILSQVSYMALIHDRPCVLLGRNQLSGKGCVYELGAREALGETVADAMKLGFVEEQRAAWLRHAAQLCRHALFAFDEATEKDIGRGLEETAAFLIDHAKELPEGFAVQGSLFGDDLSGEKGERPLSWALALLRAIDPVAKPVVKTFRKIFLPPAPVRN